jgi:hypothetical protein
MEKIAGDGKWWPIHLMSFVDDFRRSGDVRAIEAPFRPIEQKMDALAAATVESLCDELGLEPPGWLELIPENAEPWFVSGLERLKAIAIVQGPLRFRMRKFFVLENFLSRV